MKNTAMKGFLVLVLAAIVTGGVFAQTPGFSLGARAIAIKPSYKLSTDSMSYFGGFPVDLESNFGFGFAAQASYNTSELFGIQAEIVYNADKIPVKYAGTEVLTIKASSLLIPVLVRLGTTLGNGVQLTGLGGIYFTVPLGDGELVPSAALSGYATTEKGKWKGSMGAMFGGVIGYKVGSGTLFGDIRYALDFSDIEFEEMGTNYTILKKSAIHIGVGYSIAIQ